MSGHRIDLATWPRREHFDLFRVFAEPHVSVCANVPMTSLWLSCRETVRSFAALGLLAVLRAANGVPALRLRMRPEGDAPGVWSHERLGITTTFLRPDRTFAFGRLDDRGDTKDFLDQYRRAREAALAPAPLAVAPPDDDLIYHSAMPWTRFTAVSTPRNAPTDTVPRVTVGQCAEERAGLWTMPVSIEAHHALVDGVDIGDFFGALEQAATALSVA